MTSSNHRFHRLLLAVGVVFLTGVTAMAADKEQPRQLFQGNCAVCHGADRGGYIAPALDSESLRHFTPGMLEAKIVTGGLDTLMPPHPTFFDKLSRNDVKRLASYIKTKPRENLNWDLDDINGSLEVFVEDEDSLPDGPVYAIDHIDDLMAVTVRCRRRFTCGLLRRQA